MNISEVLVIAAKKWNNSNVHQLMNKENMVGWYNAMFFWNKKEGSIAAKSLQSCPTLCDSIDGSPPGSPVPGILQARTLEWVAISFSNAWKWRRSVVSDS